MIPPKKLDMLYSVTCVGKQQVPWISFDHGTPPDLEELWQGWQMGFTALSTNSVQRIVSGATHASLLLDSTDAKASAEAILQVVAATRTGRPLAKK
jgi:hypothetical protein